MRSATGYGSGASAAEHRASGWTVHFANNALRARYRWQHTRDGSEERGGLAAITLRVLGD
ncbi:hypothetical protein [Dactylosporangium sp. CA-139066]|uniref:hypothetical protein n=1 Tax=Dactylosporangium sp. CA-139066 TaxID=3239930 RepID=UPI003D8D8C0A